MPSRAALEKMAVQLNYGLPSSMSMEGLTAMPRWSEKRSIHRMSWRLHHESKELAEY